MNFGDKWATFEITDGTPANTVDLIDADKAFSIVKWFPSMSEAKGGGIYVSSLFNDGNRLLHRALGNGFEELMLRANDVSEDALAESLIKFRQLLQAATSYWTSDWGKIPVYLKIRGYRETNTRYAVIVNWSAPADTLAYFENPDKVYENVSKISLSVLIERGQFQDAPVGTDFAKEVSSVQKHYSTDEYFGTYYGGEVEPTEDLLIVSNKNIEANVDGIYRRDVSSGNWSPDLTGDNHVYIFPNPLAAGDELYIGADCQGSTIMFSDIVFDMDPTELLIGATVVWEYYNGSSWVTLSEVDNTVEFSLGGLNSVVWTRKDTWATANLNTLFGGSAPSVSRYWVRARITNIGTSGKIPKINNYPMYIANWNYLTINGSQFNCDIASKIRFDIDIQSEDLFVTQSLKEILIGTRSIARGDKFLSNIQISDQGNFSYVDVNAVAVMQGNFVNDYRAPTGRSVLIGPLPNIAGHGLANPVIIDITDHSEDFSGKYRVFVRYLLEDSSLDKNIELYMYDARFASAETYSITRVLEYNNVGGTVTVADFGVIEFAAKRLAADDVVDMEFRFGITMLESGLGTEYFTLFDITFIPVDEWSGRYQNLKSAYDAFAFRIDGDRSPKYMTIASLLSDLIDQKFYSYLTKDQVTSPKLQINADQNIYFMLFDEIASPIRVLSAAFEATIGVKLYGINRFFSQRGSL
jgi:hypothetical protein